MLTINANSTTVVHNSIVYVGVQNVFKSGEVRFKSLEIYTLLREIYNQLTICIALELHLKSRPHLTVQLCYVRLYQLSSYRGLREWSYGRQPTLSIWYIWREHVAKSISGGYDRQSKRHCN